MEGMILRFYLKSRQCTYNGLLVGGFNPSEKYKSKRESSPNRGEN